MKKIFWVLVLLFIVFSFDLVAQSNESGKVYFNHIWVAVDTEGFEAINNSDFIHNEFSANDKHSSKTESGDTWSGIYFYGVNNYVEFLDEKAQHIEAGSSGIGFSVEDAGQLKDIKKELQKTFGKHVHSQKQTKLEGEDHIKWYQSLFVNDEVHFEDTALYYLVLEYEKDIFEHKGITLDPAKKELTKKKYLSPWDSERQGKYFQEVTGLTIDLHHREFETFNKFLVSIGFKK